MFAEMLGLLVAVIACGYATMREIRRPLNEEEVSLLQLLGSRHAEVARLIAQWSAEREVFVVVDLDQAKWVAETTEARDAAQRVLQAMRELGRSSTVEHQATGQAGAA
ncbi:hypothetical protein [Burkholderia lata]|uniref:hypothetical protein n=1 Tax=Burkholderia lata (strain ATCC 17760 / DSM 23089 / LMG 22485 / NCIMB 9086 / R18194 / 383) TaxID=482957 RepID=UPI001581FD13|nr:hypothetical protein [Burkholderia lata]